MGSILFVTGAAASMAGPVFLEEQGGLPAWVARALVTHAYFAGGCYFTLGAYLGYFNVINFGREDDIQLYAGPERATSAAAYWGSLFYFIGACLFQVAVITGVWAPHGRFYVVYLEWWPQMLGGLCFSLAAGIESHHNTAATPTERVWWLCLFYLGGSLLFLLAASVGLWKATWRLESGPLSTWGVDFPYLIGSFLFYIGAWVQMMMWRAEQFGLGFISEVNQGFMQKRANAPAASALNAGTSRPPTGLRLNFSWTVMSLAVATLYAAVAAVNIGLAVAWTSAHGWILEDVPSPSALSVASEGEASVMSYTGVVLEADELFSALTSWLVAHALLLLATVLQSTPTLHPFDYLTWLKRLLEVLLLTRELLTTLKLVWQ